MKSLTQPVKAPDYALAQSILGADFITPEEVTKARPDIIYTDEQLTVLAESLSSEDVLTWCKENGYAVIPGPPKEMSVLDIREMKSTYFRFLGMERWYDHDSERFSREDKTSFGWLKIKKTPVSDSTSKNWNEQNKLLFEFERVPNAAEMTWFIITYLEVRGVGLFEDCDVRTSSFDSEGTPVEVCYHAGEGVSFGIFGIIFSYSNPGLSAAMKLQSLIP